MAVANAKSEASIGAIDDLLQCGICLERLTEPRVLSCQHYFCKKCLQACVNQRGTRSKSLKCAICRKITKLTFQGVGALPSNYAVKGLLELVNKQSKNLANGDISVVKGQNDSAERPNGNPKGKPRAAKSSKNAPNAESVTQNGAESIKDRTKDRKANRTNANPKSATVEIHQVAKKDRLVLVNLCSSTDDSSSLSDVDDTSGLDEFESDSTETSEYSDESSFSSLSDDYESTDSSSSSSDDSYGESYDESLPSASMAFGDMNIGDLVYIFSKSRKPVKGKLAHVKAYGGQLFAGVELEPGSRSWMTRDCGHVRGTSLHKWWAKRNCARAVVYLDDCLPTAVVELYI